MLFTTPDFLFLFLPAAWLGFFAIARFDVRAATLWLACASLAFYAAWDWRFAGLLVASIVFNFAVGTRLARIRGGSSAGALLCVGVAVNLLVLGFFKYANFFIVNFGAVAGADWVLPNIVLPLGISFFTFTQIAFLVDVRRGIADELDFGRYFLFVSYFPHLIAGPLLHHRQVMPQFAAPATFRPEPRMVALGLFVLAVGLAKKIGLADSLALYSSPVFDAARDGHAIGPVAAWIGTLAYTFQLYFDFSGYSDMAIGTSLLFGVRLPENFDAPYRATTIIEFWRRWHMTLSAFLRDYLYFPLGGNRHGTPRRYANLLATMTLGGLWHGASWNFVLWGAAHGALLALCHGWQHLRGSGNRPPSRTGRIAAGALTFLAVALAWVLFRAENLGAAGTLYSALIGGIDMRVASDYDATLGAIGMPPDGWGALAVLFALAATIVWIMPTTATLARIAASALARLQWQVIGAGFVFIALLAAMGASAGSSEFLYFNF